MRLFLQLTIAALVGAACTLAGFEIGVEHVQPKHKYSFSSRGIQGDKQYSLWRFDEVTGESCQLQSDEADGWIGGHCPQTR